MEEVATAELEFNTCTFSDFTFFGKQLPLSKLIFPATSLH